ncbi:hypothetical protein MNBD_GAMMA25-2338 [hydrothermal vent metagenome]|uniref:Hemerythrin-like domain-containing protein n=1 Tax=hydrothermal vent metagenome TaxID=652676 RepID=A0A3B1BDZ6_9ZZZZ
MSYCTWDSSLSIGIEEIDKQHHRIVDYINELDDANVSKDRDKVSKVLVGLTDYTKTHFIYEENLLRKSGYPLSDSHQKVHNTFIAHMDKFRLRHEQGEDVARPLMAELRIWLTNHIKKDDADYAPYAKKIQNIDKSWSDRMVSKLFS